MRRAPLVLAAVALTALPAVAQADVFVQVPTPFLGGPIWTPLPALTPDVSGRPSLAPRPTADPCRGAAGSAVVRGPEAGGEVVPLPPPGPGGPGVDEGGPGSDDPAPPSDTPADGQEATATAPATATPAMPPSAAELAQAFGGLVSPAAAD